MTISKSVAASALGLSLLAAPAFAQPSLYSHVKSTNLELVACVARARAVLNEMGFARVQSLTYSAMGASGQHSMVIRCVPERTLVFFVAAGPDLAECDRLANTAIRRF
ncbi:MAG: hypothetical protein KF889_28340 [Alphaproteobacteria bacterium]|nr:hypothetical protein [Alphaproteobacteria bacterium]MCW5743079.1 hypothetical protein [Alphaproteobacteria bacterium]